MQSSLRVLHVIGSSKFGGATGVVFALADMARERGLTVEVLTDDPATLDACKAKGVGTVPFNGIIRPIRPHRDLWAVYRLAKFLKGRYDLVHTHTTKGGAVGRLAAHLAKVPAVVHTVHGFAFHEFSRPLVIKIGAMAERSLARYCDRIVFVNEHDRLLAGQLGIGRQEQRVTIYNGVSESRLASGKGSCRDDLLKELNLPASSILCTFVGRLAPQKGLTYLLDAMALVKKAMPVVHLAIVGDGDLGNWARSRIGELGLADTVHMLGFRPDAIRWTSGGDIFVLSSLWEGHSITLLEAMGLGRPIVATNIKGNRETLTDGVDGLLVAPGNAEAIAKGILTAAKDPQLAHRLAAGARETFHRRFTEQHMKDASWDLYRTLLESKGLWHA